MIDIFGRVMYRMQIKCCSCGCKSQSSHSLELRGVAAEDVPNAIKADFRKQIPNIPVGWSMYGRDKLRCGHCKREAAA